MPAGNDGGLTVTLIVSSCPNAATILNLRLKNTYIFDVILFHSKLAFFSWKTLPRPPKLGKKTKTYPKSIAGDKKEEPAPAKLPEALIAGNCIGVIGLMGAGELLKAAGILLIALSALDVGKKTRQW